MPKFVPVNQKFFDKWSPEMAYVLGFFAADGCLTINPRGSKYLEFTSTDREILVKIRDVMESSHKISSYDPRRKNHNIRYRIQIGSQYIFHRLQDKGFTVRKSLTICFPQIPNKELPHFVRGYFDGDGTIGQFTVKRKNRKNQIHKITILKFTSGSKKFLEELYSQLRKKNVISLGGLYKKPRGGYDLQFAKHDAFQLAKWMYRNNSGLYLERKYKKFMKIMGT